MASCTQSSSSDSFSSKSLISSEPFESAQDTPYFQLSKPKNPQRDHNPDVNNLKRKLDFNDKAKIHSEKITIQHISKTKTKRKCAKTKSQLAFLQEYYTKNRSPSQAQLEEIGQEIGLSYYQVYKWFWEKRRVDKKRRKKHQNIPVSDEEDSNKLYILKEIILSKEDPFSSSAAEIIK